MTADQSQTAAIAELARLNPRLAAMAARSNARYAFAAAAMDRENGDIRAARSWRANGRAWKKYAIKLEENQ